MFEQLYNDFTTKVLPKVAEGLTITKDYFMDLASRYIKYLIIIDSACVVAGLLLALFSLFIFWRTYKWVVSKIDPSGGASALFWLVYLIGFIAGMIIMFDNGNKLIKDIYIPEIRIYEEAKPYFNK